MVSVISPACRNILTNIDLVECRIGDTQEDGGGGSLCSVVLSSSVAAHMALKQFASAIDDCEEALSLQDDSGPRARLFVRLAKCHLALGDVDTALKSFREATRIDRSSCLEFVSQKSLEHLLVLLHQVEDADGLTS